MSSAIDFLAIIFPFLGISLFFSFFVVIFCFFGFVFKRKFTRSLIVFSSILLFSISCLVVSDGLFNFHMKTSLVSVEQILYVDDLKINKEALLEALKNISPFKGMSGSRPTQVYSFSLVLNGNLYEMEIARDSQNQEMFWVFYKEFSLGGEVGFISIKE